MARSRSRGRRYNGEKKLNMKKVFAVIMAILVIVMFAITINELLKESPKTNEKVFSLAYYTIYEQEKWGVIDTKGNIIIEPTYEEMIIIPDNTKPVFICMENVNYENGTYTSKAINEKNETIYKNYDKVEVLYNHDKNNNLWYETNILKVQKDGKYGLINLEGKELLACTQDEIKPIEGTKSVYITTIDGKKGLVDNMGKIIIENKYQEITSLTNQYENGFIVKNDQGKYGVINYNKTIALQEKYDEIKNVYGNEMYVVKELETYKIVNTKGEKFLENKFEEVKEINLNDIIIKTNGKYGVVNVNGEEKLPAIYDDLTYAFSDYYIAKKENKYGIVDINNEETLPFNYNYIKYLSNIGILQAETENMQSQLLDKNFKVKVTGIITEINQDKNYIRVRENEQYKYYNFKLEQKENTEILATNTIFLSKKDGKYGYVNEKGIVVVDYIYEDATEQNKYGYVAVKKDGKWGSLDAKGKVVTECKDTLENVLIVDYIGKWHLAGDINANYYRRRKSVDGGRKTEVRGRKLEVRT